MRRIGSIICLVFSLGFPPMLTAGEFVLDLTARGWPLSPGGVFADESTSPSSAFNIEKELKYDKETRLDGRMVLEFPRFFPNLYVMATPIEIEGAENNNIRFNIGDKIFTAESDGDSQITLNELDLSLYYDIPFVRTISADMLNIDLGLNVRAVDFDGEIEHEVLGKASKSFVVPIPMVFGALQFQPLHALALEAEGRGISLGSNKAFSLVGRIRWNVLDHVFAAGGYRYDKFDIDYQGVLIDADVSGPFFEAGLSF